MTVDALSDVLNAVRLTGATFFEVAGRAPWVAEAATPDMILPMVLPGAEHLISYHVVTEGRCYARLVDGDPVEIEAGGVVLVCHGDPHLLASAKSLRSNPEVAEALPFDAEQLPFYIHYGEGEAVTTRLVCGFLACDARPFNPLLEHLPPMITAYDKPGEDDGWLSQFIRFAMSESADKRAGGESVLAKLSELMFIEVVRRYLDGLPSDRTGWLAGLRDPFVGKALSLMHAQPAHGWTIEELARGVGLSRSVMAERFTDLVGMPPMQYLARWRMQIAASMLSGGNATMAVIANRIGYESEAAFSRAFKKVVGEPPSTWRRRAEKAAQSVQAA
ncbi:AraC family transcriptional regulator [Bauldia sp.]|uniref:AraC family transcriptional regulator n=1 Tax=Bauldia sp. TaxID=2575872 RepID=UPI003BA98E4E